MEGKALREVTSEKDLGVIKFSEGMKVAAQYLKRTIRFMNYKVLVTLYKSLVRPHVEYCMSVWSPYYQKDKVLLERVHRRFTRLFPDIRDDVLS